MAASPTPKPTHAETAPGNPALAALAAHAAHAALAAPEGFGGPPFTVAFSGGADSTALLHAAAAAWPGATFAIHVNHGVQVAAPAFAAHCDTVCRALSVPLHVACVDGRHAAGQSPEDAARSVRYAALADAARAQGAGCVLLAQHADDQVETLLLALGRGAGLPGLAGMPPQFERHGMRFARPLLGLAGAALRDWLKASRIAWIEDPTNTDTAFTRNRIRHHLLPALAEVFPQFRDTFARSARHAAQAQELLAAMAAADLPQTEPVIGELQALPRSRQANVLRHWLRTRHSTAPSAAQLEELLDQVAACSTRGHCIHIKVALGFVERAGERLRYMASL